jgi:hypothetical protein
MGTEHQNSPKQNERTDRVQQINTIDHDIAPFWTKKQKQKNYYLLLTTRLL